MNCWSATPCLMPPAASCVPWTTGLMRHWESLRATDPERIRKRGCNRPRPCPYNGTNFLGCSLVGYVLEPMRITQVATSGHCEHVPQGGKPNMSQRPPTLNFWVQGLHPITAAREALF